MVILDVEKMVLQARANMKYYKFIPLAISRETSSQQKNQILTTFKIKLKGESL